MNMDVSLHLCWYHALNEPEHGGIIAILLLFLYFLYFKRYKHEGGSQLLCMLWVVLRSLCSHVLK